MKRHANDVGRKKHEPRGTTAERGYGGRWQRYRLIFLAEHPLCVECERAGKVEAATVVDHIVPHKGDQVKFWEPTNHQGLCAACHNRKTAREDMGSWTAKK